ncbi:MAG TPA: hypothetical protein VM899_11530 [Rubellimicrobium sp.]|nr:hypothetical protein [Rubellimicrobium sp.]
MAHSDLLSRGAAFRRAVLDVLEDTLGLAVPEPVVETWLRRILAEERTPIEAAVLICHAQNQLVAESWVEAGLMASELGEMVIADRIYESRRLLTRTGRDLHTVLPDLADLVRQSCFSDEFRDMVANTVSWDELIEERWASSDM